MATVYVLLLCEKDFFMRDDSSIPFNRPTSAAVMALLESGDVEGAEQQARCLVASCPDDSGAQYVLGLVHLLKGDAAGSLPILENARIEQPDNAVLICNLGVACHKSGQLDDAIRYLEKALELDPDYKDARYNLGCVLLAHGMGHEALVHFSRLVQLYPGDANYICAQADAYRDTREWKKAVNLYREAVEINAQLERAHVNVGLILLQLGYIEEALSHCQTAIELNPRRPATHKYLGDALVASERLEDAMDSYADAYELKPDWAELCVAIGDVWFETGSFSEASAWYQKALDIEAENTTALCGMAKIVQESGNSAQACEMLDSLAEKAPDNMDVRIAYCEALWSDGDAPGAIDQIRHALALQPQRVGLLARSGQIHASSGDVDSALREYSRALEQNPYCVPALSGLATTQRGKLEPEYVTTMEKLLGNDKLKSGALATLHSGLAHYYDAVKQFKKASEHMETANSMQWDFRTKRGWAYSPGQYEDYISELIETFDADYFNALENVGSSDETPVFVVAMPRSGTTLTEQILARHPAVLGIGERNFATQAFNGYLSECEGRSIKQRLSGKRGRAITSLAVRYVDVLRNLANKAGQPDALRVVDKMPDNYSMLGWILTLFPKAKIIHARRDSRDVALSCWMTQFGSIRWACHTEHLVSRIHQYQRIMGHWRQVIPDRFIEINYEDLVANQEEESRRLVEWIGLDWDPICLEFYDSDRLVRTASITQVRQPIYRRSVARWKAYEPYIDSLFDKLVP